MDVDHWKPRCELPSDLVRPVRIDHRGLTGPTKGQTRSRGWIASGGGWYVPAHAPRHQVEQRILEQGVRARIRGAVTAWAALRWYGARYFEGWDSSGGQRPIPLLRASGGGDDPAVAVSTTALPPYDRVFVRGLWCTTPPRAVFDEVARLKSLRPATVAMCMTVAAGVVTLPELVEYAELRYAWTGIPVFRETLVLANECFRSPPEVWTYLRWVLDARLPVPLVNPPVFATDGQLLGYPDLLDPEVGLVVEYDGADHLRDDRRRRDSVREDLFRDHGLDYLRVVKGELTHLDVADRMTRAHTRAALIPRVRSWTLDPPPWWTPPSWVPDRYLPG